LKNTAVFPLSSYGRLAGRDVTENSAITIAFTADGSVLRAAVRGEGSYAKTLDCWRRLAAELRERRPQGLLLVDETNGEPMSGEEWQALVRAMSGEGLERVRIAHVKPFGLQRIEYCELHAREAGYDARVFTNEKEASLWLRYGGEHSPPRT
jgi:uncharacterized radical SAM superfamily Fe-S cluster-containing enzyme